MKYSLFKYLTFGICLLFAFNAMAIHKKEYYLEFKYSDVAPFNYSHAADEFKSLMRINTACETGSGTPVPITVTVSDTFESNQIEILEKNLDDKDMVSGKFFRALRMFYAINNYDSLCIIYFVDHATLNPHTIPKPKADTFTLQKGDDILNFKDDDPVYICKEKKFKEVKFKEVKKWVEKYRSRAQLNRRHASFECYNYDSSDVNSVLYPFKELQHFDTYGSLVYFTHISYLSDKFNGPMYRHDIQVANILPNGEAERRHDKHIANLGSMCPVNCAMAIVQDRVIKPEHFFLLNSPTKKYKPFRYKVLVRD